MERFEAPEVADNSSAMALNSSVVQELQSSHFSMEAKDHNPTADKMLPKVELFDGGELQGDGPSSSKAVAFPITKAVASSGKEAITSSGREETQGPKTQEPSFICDIGDPFFTPKVDKPFDGDPFFTPKVDKPFDGDPFFTIDVPEKPSCVAILEGEQAKDTKTEGKNTDGGTSKSKITENTGPAIVAGDKSIGLEGNGPAQGELNKPAGRNGKGSDRAEGQNSGRDGNGSSKVEESKGPDQGEGDRSVPPIGDGGDYGDLRNPNLIDQAERDMITEYVEYQRMKEGVTGLDVRVTLAKFMDDFNNHIDIWNSDSIQPRELEWFLDRNAYTDRNGYLRPRDSSKVTQEEIIAVQKALNNFDKIAGLTDNQIFGETNITWGDIAKLNDRTHLN